MHLWDMKLGIIMDAFNITALFFWIYYASSLKSVLWCLSQLSIL